MAALFATLFATDADGPRNPPERPGRDGVPGRSADHRSTARRRVRRPGPRRGPAGLPLRHPGLPGRPEPTLDRGRRLRRSRTRTPSTHALRRRRHPARRARRRAPRARSAEDDATVSTLTPRGPCPTCRVARRSSRRAGLRSRRVRRPRRRPAAGVHPAAARADPDRSPDRAERPGAGDAQHHPPRRDDGWGIPPRGDRPTRRPRSHHHRDHPPRASPTRTPLHPVEEAGRLRPLPAT